MYMYPSLYRRRSYSLHINIILESGDEIANQVMKFVNQVVANQVMESGDGVGREV